MSGGPVSIRKEHWIDGAERRPEKVQYLESTNPATGATVAEVARGSAADVDAAVTSAANRFIAWAERTPAERSAVLHQVAQRLRAHAGELIELERAETGKPQAAAVADVALAADYFEYYGSLTRSLRDETIHAGPGQHIFTRREPYGVVGIITPWNVPITQAARGVAPALAVGNAVVVKPSEFTSLTTLEMAAIAHEAGLVSGVLNVVTGTGPEAGEPLARHPGVRRIAFTGSVAVGRRIGQIGAERIVPVSLELGGKSPNVVFADADLDAAAAAAVGTVVTNAGQICSAGTRLLVEEQVHDALMKRIATRIAAVRPGLDMGPIITDAQHERVRSALDRARREGIEAVITGTEEEGRRNYVAPHVFDHLPADSALATDEIFGPVLTVFRFATEDEAVALANDTDYGLVAGVWTSQLGRALRVANRLQAGQVFVNQWAAPIEAPFGGYKNSGHGREKGAEALREYTQLKTVLVNLGG